MAYEQRDGDVSIFKNDKGNNPKRPEYRGEAMIDGQKYQIALWIKEGKRGKFFAGNIKLAEEGGGRKFGEGQGGGGQYPSRRPDRDRPPAENPISEEQQFSDNDIPF